MVSRYTRGSDVLRLLQSTRGAVRAQASERQEELRRLERAAREDVRRRGDQLMELAQHYLPAVNRQTVDTAFAEVRDALHNILVRKEHKEEELQRDWDLALDRRQKLQLELDKVTAELDALVERREELEQRLAEVLEDDEGFQDLSRRALWEEQELERNLQRVDEARQEAEAKLPAYEQSRLFRYLRDRGYGTDRYKKRGLTRRLDRWVAGLVKFDKAKKSYDFLKVTPELMAAEVQRLRDEFERLMGQVEQIQERYSVDLGLTEALKEGMKAGKRRDATLTKIDAEQEDQEQLERELENLAGADNEFYQQAVDRMRRFLGGLEESVLEAKTKGTAEQKDDAIFAEISWLNERLAEAKQKADEARRVQAGLQRQRYDLSDLSRRFQVAEYDSKRSVFPEAFDPRPDIEGFLRGQVSKEQLWESIKSQQRFLPTWVERNYEGSRDLMDNEFSYLLVRVLAEAAGAAIRHAADSNRRSKRRRAGRSSSVRRRARDRFTDGFGF